MPEEPSSKDIPYTNRELREKWHDISNDLQNIIVQTTKTNGSVAELNRWRERINGGAIVTGVFMSLIVMPILVFAIITLVNLPESIDEAVDKALSAYEVKIEK